MYNNCSCHLLRNEKTGWHILEKSFFNPSRPDPKQREKLSSVFIFILLCGASKGFIKLFEAPQRSIKIKF